MSYSEKEIWQIPCHTEYIQIVVSSSSDGRIMICFRFCLLEGNDNGSEHIISLIGGRHTVSFKLTHPKCPFSCSSCSDSPTQTWKSGHCYRSNKRGHWRRDCTEKMDVNKIS